MLHFNATNFKIHLIKKHPVMICVHGKDSKQQVIPQTLYGGNLMKKQAKRIRN